PQMPSPFFRRLMMILPDVQPEIIRSDDCDSADTIGTPRQLVTRLMRWVRSNTVVNPGVRASACMEQDQKQDMRAEARTPGAFPSLYQWLATYKCCDDAIDVMRFRAWRALTYDNHAKLSPELAAELFSSPLRASVSRIETFATCPFKHFA